MLERMGLSKRFHETIGVGIVKAREAAASRKLKEFPSGEYFSYKRPHYVSQLANADRNLISGFYGRIEDEGAAERFGAENLDQFSYWAWRSCGIAAVQAVIRTVKEAKRERFDKTTMDLVNEGLKLGGYNTKTDVGWYHIALATIAEQYGISASLHKFIPPSEIALVLANKNFALASVKSDTGGHFLLLYGFKINKEKKLVGFWHHDPNDYSEDGKGKFISRSELEVLSTHRIIRLSAAV